MKKFLIYKTKDEKTPSLVKNNFRLLTETALSKEAVPMRLNLIELNLCSMKVFAPVVAQTRVKLVSHV